MTFFSEKTLLAIGYYMKPKTSEKYAYILFIKLKPIFSKNVNAKKEFISGINMSRNVTTVSKNL